MPEIPPGYRRGSYVVGGLGVLAWIIPQLIRWFNIGFTTIHQWNQSDSSLCVCFQPK